MDVTFGSGVLKLLGFNSTTIKPSTIEVCNLYINQSTTGRLFWKSKVSHYVHMSEDNELRIVQEKAKEDQYEAIRIFFENDKPMRISRTKVTEPEADQSVSVENIDNLNLDAGNYEDLGDESDSEDEASK